MSLAAIPNSSFEIRNSKFNLPSSPLIALHSPAAQRLAPPGPPRPLAHARGDTRFQILHSKFEIRNSISRRPLSWRCTRRRRWPRLLFDDAAFSLFADDDRDGVARADRRAAHRKLAND